MQKRISIIFHVSLLLISFQTNSFYRVQKTIKLLHIVGIESKLGEQRNRKMRVEQEYTRWPMPAKYMGAENPTYAASP